MVAPNSTIDARRRAASEEVVHKVEPGHLSPASCTVNGLDNQWVPRAMLNHMLDYRIARSDVLPQIAGLARQEYLRALLNSRHVILNRAYLYSADAVNGDYIDESKRDFFGQLLAQKAIVPFFFNETDALTPPKLQVNVAAHEAWKSVARSYDIYCARLSWTDDQLNSDLCKQALSRKFHDFAVTLHTADVDRLALRLGIAGDQLPAFRARLKDLRNVSNAFHDANDRHVTREHLYQQFVCGDGAESVVKGEYDRAKPFAAVIKELLDLRYNLNLPDAMRCCSLTAQDSLPRAVLPVDAQAARQLAPVNAGNLAEQLIALREFEFLSDQLWEIDLRRLEIEDIVHIRWRAEWEQYMRAIERLMANPLQFGDPAVGIQNVIKQYRSLARPIRERMKHRAGRNLLEGAETASDFAPLVVGLAIPVLGTVLEVTVLGAKVVAKVFPKRMEKLVNRMEKLSGSFVIGSRALLTESEPEMSQQWLEGKLNAAKDDIHALIGELQRNGVEVQTAESRSRDLSNESSNNSLPEEE